jgi:acetylornithine deacetylase/succinyl-diaminopimelate desuccinylase-like protein
MECVDGYVNALKIEGISKKVFDPEGKSPMVVYVVEPTGGCTQQVMMYGHLDKQPWMEGWADGLSPIVPVTRGEYMYGRGGADDGYSVFSCMLAIKNAQLQGAKLPRCAMVLETEEESGSPSLLDLLALAKDTIGRVDFCFCMDSGAFDYDKLWCTSSLRGVTIVDATVTGAATGYHSGEVGGIVPETFRVVRKLLDRVDDVDTGEVKLPELHCDIPEWAQKEAGEMAALSGDGLFKKYARVDGAKAMSEDDLKGLYLNNTWKPNLSITGAAGLPDIKIAGNVIRASTSVRLSCRLPPSVNPSKATEAIVKAITTDVPYNLKVDIEAGHEGQGWCMKDLEPWIDAAMRKAGREFFDGKDTGTYGMGGSIPFLSELGNMYPDGVIMAFGLIGPYANAHAPNECINLTYAKKLTCALSHMLAEVGAR